MVEQIEKAVHHQPLGSDVQHFDLAAAAPRHHFELLLTRLRRVIAGGGNAIGQQLIDLIFHQRNQRGNH
ncbi:hypothetical protein D3C86_1795190 [compost metagenome]